MGLSGGEAKSGGAKVCSRYSASFFLSLRSDYVFLPFIVVQASGHETSWLTHLSSLQLWQKYYRTHCMIWLLMNKLLHLLNGLYWTFFSVAGCCWSVSTKTFLVQQVAQLCALPCPAREAGGSKGSLSCCDHIYLGFGLLDDRKRSLTQQEQKGRKERARVCGRHVRPIAVRIDVQGSR